MDAINLSILADAVPDEIDYDKYEGLTIQQAAAEMVKIKDLLDKAKKIKTHIQKVYDHLRLAKIPETMDDYEINTITLKNIGRVTLTSDIYASIPADKRSEAWGWLRDNNHGSIIKETINGGTLKATLKAMMKQGEVIPEELFKVTPFSRASITKVK